MTLFERKWPALLLWPLSNIYRFFVAIRNLFYDIGLFKSYAVDAFVISVGNITVGGTGKTPTVQYLANTFISLNKKVAIISRGYGRQSRGTVLVSDGQRIVVSVADAGDEPFLLAQSCRGAVVFVDSNRVRAAEFAVDRFKPDVIVLDDAFQHRRIERDFDLLTFRAGNPVGNGFCLPAGPLREPVRNISRAHALLFNGSGGPEKSKFAGKMPHIFFAEYRPRALLSQYSESELAILREKRVYAFCGLANPVGFKDTLEKLNVNLLGFTAFKDHHSFNTKDVLKIKKAAAELSAEIIVTT